MSVLLRQAHGFEGVTPSDEGVDAGRLPVALLNQVGYLRLDDDAASEPLSRSFQRRPQFVPLVRPMRPFRASLNRAPRRGRTNCLLTEAPRAGFEPAAYSLGGSRSVQLSYRGKARAGMPPTGSGE